MTDLLHAKKVIDSVDLTFVLERIVTIENWKKEEALEAAKQYRKYLYLKLKYRDEYELPPSKEIDEIWHAHILHTEDYIKFCDEAFGGYLHHHPHHRKGKITDQQLIEFFETQTQKLYHKEFGEYIYTVRAIPLKKRAFIFLRRLMILIRNPSAVSLET